MAEILSLDDSLIVLHIDRNRSNNRADNLRLATYSQNQWNQVSKGWQGGAVWYAQFECVIADAVQTHPATLLDPPEFGPAACRGIVLLDDEPGAWLRFTTEAEQLELARDVDEWVPLSGD